MNQPEYEVQSKATAQFNQRLDWAEQIKPRGCKVTQVSSKGFWFIRPEKAAAEFMAWPGSIAATDARQYGRVER